MAAMIHDFLTYEQLRSYGVRIGISIELTMHARSASWQAFGWACRLMSFAKRGRMHRKRR